MLFLFTLFPSLLSTLNYLKGDISIIRFASNVGQRGHSLGLRNRYWIMGLIIKTLFDNNLNVPMLANWANKIEHYSDVIMGTIASQITSLTGVYSTAYSDAEQRKRQTSASQAFVRGIHRGPVNSPHKWPVTRKMFTFDDVIMNTKSQSSDCEPNKLFVFKKKNNLHNPLSDAILLVQPNHISYTYNCVYTYLVDTYKARASSSKWN